MGFGGVEGVSEGVGVGTSGCGVFWVVGVSDMLDIGYWSQRFF